MRRLRSIAVTLAPRVVLSAGLLAAAGLSLVAGGCPAVDSGDTTNPDALDVGEGVPGENDFTFDVDGDGDLETFDTGLVFQDEEDYANDPIAPPPDEIPATETTPAGTLPPSVDLTSSLPPVSNQGQLGSCAAFACGYGLATWNSNKVRGVGLATADVQASPAFLYAKTMEKQKSACDAGSEMDTVMNLLVSDGCSSLATVPYSDTACVQNPSAADAAGFRIGSFGRIENPKDRTRLKTSLAAGRPLAIGVATAKNFGEYNGGVYTSAGGDSSGKHSGHAMVLVGYDDARGAYKIMNSWDTNWGEAGFMFWEYADFERACDEAYEVFAAAGGGGTARVRDGANGKYDATADQRRDAQGAAYLVLTVALPVAVQVESIHGVDPQGTAVESDYGNNWFAAGPISFVHPDGQDWLAGRYEVTLRGVQADGTPVELSAVADFGGAKASTARGNASGAGFGPEVRGANLKTVRMLDR